MRCPRCQNPAADDAAFCGRCGASLKALVFCSSCGRPSPDDNDFCPGCGTRLGPGAPPPPPSPGVEGERRYLTVMFTDLADSTRLAGELDPEDMRDLVQAYQAACAGAITANSGYLANYMGDGILAYFGYPAAHEDDARLAVAAGLEILEAVPTLRDAFGRTDVSVRVGVHTGEVVVADMGAAERRQESDVVGETPNVAARLQAVAGLDTVVISERTVDLIRGWYELEDLGELSLKGVARPVAAFRVVGPTQARTRLEAVAARGLTPLVGRDAEMAELFARWEAAGEDGGVVLLSGEPGIGKSRLTYELRDRVENAGSPCLRLRCSPYHGNSALFPVVEHMLNVVGRGRGDDGDRLDRLEAELQGCGMAVERAASLLAELLAIPTGDRYAPSTDSPERRKRRTLDCLFSWLCAQARDDPLLLVVEDVHWIDPSTLELLSRFYGPDPVPCILLLVTHRADYVPPWTDRRHVRRLALERLSGEAVGALVEQVAGGRTLPAVLEEQISARTDGVPLFVEEVTQAVLESGAVAEEEGRLVATATLPERLVPGTLRESLMARLDRLGTAREVAQVLAVVGRPVSEDFVREAAGLDEDEIESGLDRLVSADLVRRRDHGAGWRYDLKHWLVQDVAYESLLRSRRRSLHERIAAQLPAEMPDIAETQPEFIAHHLIAAGQEDEAIGYLARAGELAHRRSASLEAIGHLTRALELVRRQPESRDRQRRELSLLTALGAALTVVKGYSADEVATTYERAAELCRALGADDSPEFFRTLYGTWRVHLLRADYDEALEFADQLLRLAVPGGTELQLAAAHRAIGSTLFYLGRDPVKAREHLGQVITSEALSSRRMSFVDELRDIVDPWITCHAYTAWSLWLEGRPEEAAAMSDRAIELATALGHPFTNALALSFDSWLRQFLGDVEGTARRAREDLTLSSEQGFAFWIGWAEIMGGWAEGALGDDEDGLKAMRRGLNSWHAVGSELGTVYFLALVAEVELAAGRLDEGWRSLDAAEEVAERTGEEWWMPEVKRLRGVLLDRRGAPDKAVEQALSGAYTLARGRGSASLALRAAASLAERARDRDAGVPEARARLEEALAAIGPAANDAGAQRAAALLAELA